MNRTCEFHTKTPRRYWLTLTAIAALTLPDGAMMLSRRAVVSAQPARQAADTRAAVAAIEAKASLEFDEESPERSVVGVRFGKRIDDDSFVALIEHLRKLPKLRKLSFSSANMTEAGLAHLKELPSVESITIRRSPITDATLEHLKDLPNLKKLTLQGDRATRITKASLIHLRNLSQLNDLQLVLQGTTDEDLNGLEGLTSLKELSIRSEGVTSAGMVHVGGLRGLETLRLTWTEVGDAGLEHLKELTNLRTLQIHGNATRGWAGRRDKEVSSKGMAHIESLTSLTNLMLTNTLVDDDGLKYLKILRNSTFCILPRTSALPTTALPTSRE